MAASLWFATPPDDGRLPVFCLPYAGTGSAVFAGWQAHLPAWLAPVPVRLPGREGRLDEPAFDRIEHLIPALADAVAPHARTPYALLGCSMGALMAFELAHALKGRGLPEPVCLIGVSAVPPHRVPRRPPIAHLDDADLLTAVQARYGSIPDEVIAVPELRSLVAPPLRADLAMFERYAAEPDRKPLSCPVAAVAGVSDAMVPHQLLLGWGELTVGPFAPILVPGGHFVARETPERVLAPLVDAVSPLLPERSPGTSAMAV